jgi:predicted membrane channel-forming protein YqfA (hemolysin III family)
MGVMATAVLDGWIAKAAYQYLVTRRNLVSFVIMGQIGFIYYIQLFPTAPFPIFWIWLLTQGAVFWIFGSLAPVARNRGATEYVSSPVARPIDREPHPEITGN